MTDTASTVQTIQTWITNMQSLSSRLGASDATSPSDFAQAFAEMQALLGTNPLSGSNTDATSDALTPNASDISATNSDVTGSDVTTLAGQYLGVPYLWGGTTPSGFDCSGFTQYVYGQLGVSLPRTAAEQAQVGGPIASLAAAQPGDLVFFPGSDGTVSSPGHVGIYLGNGEMIDAPQTGEDVSIQPVGDPVAIRRVVPQDNGQITLDSNISSTTPSSSVPSDLASDFVDAAGKYGIPVQLLTAVARTESNFNPNAVSSAGALGIMQLLPQTAASLGVDPMNPQEAIAGAAQLLSGYIAQFGSVPLALAAYNAGPGAVEQAGGIPPYPETEAYVQQITQSLGANSSGSPQ